MKQESIKIKTKSTKVWDAIKQSLNGIPVDYTQGSIPKAVFLLAIPMMLELSLESVFALVDMYFVGKLRNNNAIATVGMTESVLTIVYSLAIGLSMGATAIVARRIGEKNPEAAARAGAQSILIVAIASVILSIAGVYYASDILWLMSKNEALVKEGTIFTQIMFGGSIGLMLLFLINGIYRGAGDAFMAMKSLWIASIINIILCPVFIHFWGLKGAAIATVIGRSSGVIYQCVHLFSGKGILKFQAWHFNWNWELCWSVIKLGLPATAQFIIGSGSWIVLTLLVAHSGGPDGSAGYQIAIRNVTFFILPAWGLSNAAATLVGQNLGAGQIERAEKSVMLTAKYNALFMSFVMLLFVLLPEPIIRFFSVDEKVIAYGVEALRIIGMGYVFYGIGMVMTQALNGAGDTKTPTLINFFCFWSLQIPLAIYLMKVMNMGTTGVIIAIPVAETAIALMAWYYFKKGKWKTIKV